ncbi:PQQ-dependent sugar dehydrogenase [Natronocalculus amylovorans]|uniref:PQQ-dependent sugar dehydrogenase n=1 Tax=Natronocalculus amylovorans TaxID=2917812 RepID=A0AAE3FWG9_9EURY|nr:PQQ-dependent sugar dehydrogenase [Natronocalculus amylovorans]MCL9816609.1 PQQ-dependent sugar dehydrogenase [Natronocalculus amylovorans]
MTSNRQPRRITRRQLLSASGAIGTVSLAGCTSSLPNPFSSAGADGVDSDEYEIEEVVDGLDSPWGLAFVPDSSELFVTEVDGQLLRIECEEGTTEFIEGLPDVSTRGQGGLLDIALHPAFSDEPWVYLTYAAANGNGETTTHVGRGLLSDTEPAFAEFEQLRAAEPFVDSGQHYGSRVMFGPDEMLYVTVGDRGFKDFGPDHVSQDTTNELGTTLRLTPSGEVPSDNPFVDDSEVVDSIFSYGHRNAQGMTIHPETDEIWQSEHGEQDGDSIRVVDAGENHGWPIAHYGCTYGGGDPVGDEPHERDDVVDPRYYWECNSGGFPPAGMTFYTGDAFPAWNGDLFVGNLAGQYLGRFVVDEDSVAETNPLLDGAEWRIRDVAEAPDTGHLYVLIDDSDVPLVRLVPK